MAYRVKNIVLIVFVLVLAVLPLLFIHGREFSGADGQAEQVIAETNPDYQPWLSSIWEPPSSEVESFLFTVQGAVGACFIGYYFGYMKGRKDAKN
ncbi:energy-coupling factor ABC transporter substrate-binding protein [Pelotomaculum isophthalicicum JI]|uniref:Cobalt transport protein CbiN n=1 Tax=Pelotomaculum isophthalicicum JI TaxID=947010 RepID=A0A9X4H8C5_9FIRM|nr:energy-coupling factor ABC transporter substrate-binding protein [Pelotomaculum isophthalicicum]MDF9408839.1 energy-coupling factor ABC transporter substrate-binding protein [Pelotomaculum isophthalicicum JI]